jgi:hypothetical protein
VTESNGGGRRRSLQSITTPTTLSNHHHHHHHHHHHNTTLTTAQPGGPPFAMSFDLLKSLLEPLGFQAERLEPLPPELSHRGRDGSGNWCASSGIGLWRLP